jgi:hypothetical protein
MELDAVVVVIAIPEAGGVPRRLAHRFRLVDVPRNEM